MEVWRPSWRRIVPRGLPLYPFAVFWILHRLRIFKNRGYTVILIRDAGQVIHRSTIFPCYFRFPFMQHDELQVGMWTHPAYRGRGLARLALRKALDLAHAESRKIWYIVDEKNLTSVRIASKVGLAPAGRGRRRSLLGLRMFSRLVLDTPFPVSEKRDLGTLNSS